MISTEFLQSIADDYVAGRALTLTFDQIHSMATELLALRRDVARLTDGRHAYREAQVISAAALLLRDMVVRPGYGLPPGPVDSEDRALVDRSVDVAMAIVDCARIRLRDLAENSAPVSPGDPGVGPPG